MLRIAYVQAMLILKARDAIDAIETAAAAQLRIDVMILTAARQAGLIGIWRMLRTARLRASIELLSGE